MSHSSLLLQLQVNNAGFAVEATMETMAMEQYDKLFRINVRAVVQLSKLAIPYLKKNKGQSPALS